MPALKDAPVAKASAAISTVFVESHKGVTLKIDMQMPPRERSGRCRELLAEARQDWRDQSVEWKKALEMAGQVQDTAAAILAAEREQRSASDAVRAALASGGDPSGAESRVAAARQKIDTLRDRAKTLGEMEPQARAALAAAWSRSCPAILLEVRRLLAEELETAREELFAEIGPEKIDRLVDLTAEVQTSLYQGLQGDFYRP